MTTYKVQQGNHFSDPRAFKIYWLPKGLETTAVFHKNCDYDLMDEDQQDWNKLTGLTFSIDPTEETVMVGWRYNKKDDNIELNAYYHIKGKTEYTDTLLKVKRGEKITAFTHVDYINKFYQVVLVKPTEVEEHKQNFTHNRKLARRINLYFGGNEAAPQDISVELGYKLVNGTI